MSYIFTEADVSCTLLRTSISAGRAIFGGNGRGFGTFEFGNEKENWGGGGGNEALIGVFPAGGNKPLALNCASSEISPLGGPGIRGFGGCGVRACGSCIGIVALDIIFVVC